MKGKISTIELEPGERFEIKTSPYSEFLGAEVTLYSNCGGASMRFNHESADAARQLAAALMVSADELEEEAKRYAAEG